MYYENDVIEFGKAPFYSFNFMPYKPVGMEAEGDKFSPLYARKVLKKYDAYTQRDSIKRLKARMILHMPLTFGEILRLQQAQENANGYAHINRKYNVLGLEKYLIR